MFYRFLKHTLCVTCLLFFSAMGYSIAQSAGVAQSTTAVEPSEENQGKITIQPTFGTGYHGWGVVLEDDLYENNETFGGYSFSTNRSWFMNPRFNHRAGYIYRDAVRLGTFDEGEVNATDWVVARTAVEDSNFTMRDFPQHLDITMWWIAEEPAEGGGRGINDNLVLSIGVSSLF